MSKKSGDFQDFLMARMAKKAPSSAEWGIYEISRTNKQVLSKISYVLTTGIASFDDVVGGFPFGRVTELYGLESSGKTAMSIRAAARACAGCVSEVILNPDGSTTYKPLEPDTYEVAVLYIDNEGSLDDDNKIVIDGKALDVIGGRCDTIEGVFKMTDDFLDGAKMKAELDDEAAKKAGVAPKLKFLVIVVDTIASTSSREELGQAWGKQDFPRVPKEIGKGFSRILRRLSKHNACMICTNQVRTNYNAAAVKGGRPSSASRSLQYNNLGGMALKFYASHRVFVEAMQSKYRLVPDAKFAAGFQISFHTVKNRLKAPLREGRMVLLFDKENGGLNNEFSMLENLVFTKFIEIEQPEKGTNFVCKFAKNGIPTTTFGDAVKTSLDEDDSAPRPKRGGKKDPSFRYRAEWPQFYHDHKADLDALWEAAVRWTFETRGISGAVEDDDEGFDEEE